MQPEFEERLSEICGLYVDPPENMLVASLDEKTGIQAKSPTKPDRPPQPGKPAFFSILYRRLLKHGTFTSEHDLAEQMLAFVETHNQTAKPFKWTYTGKVLEA